MIKLNQIYNEDCVETIQKIPDNFLNLIITSPPYNVNLGNNKFHKNPYDLYIDNKEHKNYINWLKNIFSLLYLKLKDDGRICINIGDGKNGAIPTSSDIIQFMKDLLYIPITHIIWHKSQIGNRTSWGSFNSPSSPSFPTPFEHILIFCKKSKKLLHQGETDLIKEEFIKWSLALWEFTPETQQKKIGHNAMFPEELPKRCIKMFSYINDIVYDPFAGAGTTLVVSQKLKRNFIGSEISQNYCEIIKKRLLEIT